MAKLEIYQFPTRSDNYGVLIHDPETGATAAIDAPEAEPILAALKDKGWSLTDILVTHHHADHTAGRQSHCGVYAVDLHCPCERHFRHNNPQHD